MAAKSRTKQEEMKLRESMGYDAKKMADRVSGHSSETVTVAADIHFVCRSFGAHRRQSGSWRWRRPSPTSYWWYPTGAVKFGQVTHFQHGDQRLTLNLPNNHLVRQLKATSFTSR